MTIQSHVAEVLRQGIWASLTGGWFFDPRQSLFCNTVHLYIWIFLFLFPLILGLSIGRSSGLALSLTYTLSLAVLFIIIKSLVWYLHKLFDSKEPLEVQALTTERGRLEAGIDPEEGEKVSTASNEIELSTFCVNEPTSPFHQDNSDSAPREPRTVRIGPVSVGDLAVAADVHSNPRDRDRASSGGSHSHSSDQALLPNKGESGACGEEKEMLNLSDGSPFRRKYSEPNFSSQRRSSADLRRRLRSNLPVGEGVRRVQSSLERGSISSSSFRLSHQTLEECKLRGVRKSYPSKTSSTDIFLSQDRPLRGTILRKDLASDNADAIRVCEEIEMQDMPCSSKDIPEGFEDASTVSSVIPSSDVGSRAASYVTADSGSSTATIASGSTSSAATATSEVQLNSSSRPDSPISQVKGQFRRHLRVRLDEFRSEASEVLPEESSLGSSPADSPSLARGRSTPNISWLFEEQEQPPPLPMEVEASDRADSLTRPTYFQSTLFPSGAGPSSQRVAKNGAALLDVKEELKLLLEQIIESHPEALEAIESVRERRLGRDRADESGRESERSLVPTIRQSPYRSREPRRRLSEAARTRPLPGPSRPSPRGPSEGSSSGLSALAALAARSTTHIANSHEDTTEGALHCFQDDEGNWWTYTFDSDGVGTAQGLGSSVAVMEMLSSQSQEGVAESEEKEVVRKRTGYSSARPRSDSSSSGDSYMAEIPTSVLHPATATHITRGENPFFSNLGRRSLSRRSTGRSGGSGDRRHPLQVMIERTLAASGSATTPGDISTITLGSSSRLRAVSGSGHSSNFEGSGSSLHRLRFLTGVNMGEVARAGKTGARRRESVRKKIYYKVNLFPKLFPQRAIKIYLDRLKLLSLFDQNSHPMSAMVDIAIAIATAVLAVFLLRFGYFQDIWLVLFCFVVAGAQFSLLKSVQPDASSPVHGYNWVVTYSRPLYLCLLSLILLTIDHWIPAVVDSESYTLFREWGRDVVSTAIVLLPIAFTLGLLPQANTLLMHVLEQIDMNVFGGTATFNLLSAVYSLSRSLLTGAVLFAGCRALLLTPPGTKHSLLFSAFSGILVSLSYLLSRASSDFSLIWGLVLQALRKTDSDTALLLDSFSEAQKETVRERLRHDGIMALLFGLLTFGLHSGTAFTKLEPALQTVLISVTIFIGFANNYLIPQLRKQTPWLLLAQPLLRSSEFRLFETSTMAQVMWFERVYSLLGLLERNVLYPALILGAISDPKIKALSNDWLAALLVVVAGLRLLRGAFNSTHAMFWPLVAATLFFYFDHSPQGAAHIFLLHYYVAVALWPKLMELLLKLGFIFAYIAPWQISWGSAFHAFAQPFAVPHSALTLAQAFFSSIISAPLNPFLGSSFFLLSYMRPVKFWEKDYNTKRLDHSNTRLSAQIDRGPMLDDSNLNAIFYEHLTRSLQKSLAGDLVMGRWATSVEPGDCFILASFYLNCLVHIVEVGNGFVSFQLRGLEFRGTYCQQREVEAISEDIAEGEGCFCCEPGRIPGFLSLNTAWTLRWLAWEVTTTKYIVEGYSITDNSAVSMLQVHELRRLLITLYVKCILFYAVMSPQLEEWLEMEAVASTLDSITRSNGRHVDVDALFSPSNDEDYDSRLGGISTRSFCDVYLGWLSYCVRRRGSTPVHRNSPIVALCYSLSLVGRRALGTASHNRHSSGAESFLYGLHSLFKGDLRITCPRDEWVFGDMDLLRCVIAPAVRMALKLHQDHFMSPEDFEEPDSFFAKLRNYESNIFISHEHDPAWRQAVLSNTPSLLALRHVFDDGQDDFKIIMLNKRFLTFRLIKLNKESVRSFWAGQQQELIFLRNRNPERGSIQNARQVLRNMINSSADQPIGYPIYVSPLTISFVETHPQLSRVVGPSLSLGLFRHLGASSWGWLRKHCGASSSSSASLPPNPTEEARSEEARPVVAYQPSRSSAEPREVRVAASSDASSTRSRGVSFLQEHSTARGSEKPRPRSSVVSEDKKAEGSPSMGTKVRLGSLFSDTEHSASVVERVRILDPSQIHERLNIPRGVGGQTLVVWPNEAWRKKGGRSGWAEDWECSEGTEGSVVHRWTPSNPDPGLRAHLGKVILLLQVDTGVFVPVNEEAVEYVGQEV